MSEVYFYHLTRTSLEQTMFQLLDRSLQNTWRVLVRSGAPDQLARLDDVLWGGNNAQFLPHGVAGGEQDVDQPVLLTTDQGNANNAQALMLILGAQTTPDEVAAYERVSLIFNGNDPDALDSARSDWKTLTGAGVAAKYWSQESGRWEMRSESSSA